MSQTAERKLAYIEVSKVTPNPAALRQVNKTGEKYLDLVNSVRHQNILKPILVHEIVDKDTGAITYGLSDGLHRFTAAKDCGYDTIPAQIVPMAESEVLITQIMANVHTIETKPAEYADALVRLMGEKPTMTINELSGKLDKSPGWLSDRLSLTNLNDNIKSLVDEDKINLTSAYALAKLAALDESEQDAFLERAQTESPEVFVPTVTARIKEIKEARKKGQAAAAETFVAIPHARSVTDLKNEYESGTIATLQAQAGKINDVASFKAGIAYAIKLDEDTVTASKAKWEAQRKERTEKKAKAEEGKKQKNLDEARKVLEGMGLKVVDPNVAA